MTSGSRARRQRRRQLDSGASTSAPRGRVPKLGKLCQFCESLDFNRLGFHKASRLISTDLASTIPSRISVPTRRIGEILNGKDHGCVICGEVAKYYEEWKTQYGDGLDAPYLHDSAAEYHIEFLIARIIGADGGFKFSEGLVKRFMVHLRICTEKEDKVLFQPLIQFQKCSNPALQHLDWDRGEEQPYNGRIRPPKVDPELLRKWIDTCCGSHRDRCKSCIQVKSPLKWLRLIDVKERCLVVHNLGPNDECCPYVALSYVWGKHKLDENDVTMPELRRGEEKFLQEPKSLTRGKVLATIDDAMTLVDQLGEQYLWVDCLCILQDDEDDQEYFINAMDSIYGCALLTIVAASGDHANAGLPGIRSDRSSQEVIRLKNGISLLQTLDPKGNPKSFAGFKYVGGSTWSTRGWTFQEKILSRRTLIFTKEQVYWECQGATWCEDSFWETKKSPILYRQCFDADSFCLPWIYDNDILFFCRYEKLVAEYIERKLTRRSDGLRAFQGILNALETGPGKHEFLWGLPQPFLANALMWTIGFTTRNESCPITSDDTWVRPSWSWVGWVGMVESLRYQIHGQMLDLHFYYLDGTTKLVEVQHHANFIPRTSLSDNGLLTFPMRKHTDRINVDINDSQVQEVLSKSVASNILFFWSSAVKFHVQVERETPCSCELLKLRHVITEGVHVNMPANFEFCNMSLPTHLSECELVVIGSFDDPFELDIAYVNVLVCYEKDGILYRMGLENIHIREWMDCKPYWKLICLG